MVKKTKQPRVIRHHAFLQFLESTNKDQRKQLLKLANKEQILSVCECAYNIVKKNVELTPAELKQLRKYRHILYIMCDPHYSVVAKKKTLIQEGGIAFLPALLAPIIGSLVGAAISR